MTDEPLWCIHIPGPDDLHAQPSREAAERAAEKHNQAIRFYLERSTRTEFDPLESSLMAVVAPWPWSAESHAKNMVVHGEGAADE